MDFGLDEQQLLLVDMVQRYLGEHCELERVRAAVDDYQTVSEGLTDGLRELGVMALLVPEEFGGSGLGLLEAVLIQEQLGRFAAPVPFASRAVLATLALSLGGDDAKRQRWLPAIAAGSVRFAAALNSAYGAREGAGVSTTQDATGRSVLDGRALFAADLEGATHVLVLAGDGVLHLAALDSPGVSQQSLPTIDKTRRTAELVFESVPAEALDRAASARVVAAERLMLAADSLGAASVMLERAVDYAGEREQFGRVIGSFQAVKHMCAEMAARLEPCRSLMWYAAHAADQQQDDAELMSLLLKSHVAEVGQFVARTATEVHGGMGFTDLLGLHYWFKRIGANRQLGGTPERLRERAARLQGWA